jgi:FtsP/CotA-like multicopper oxidase with cupredoxin domain
MLSSQAGTLIQRDAHAHVWAQIESWLADPFDATAVRAFRATCARGVLGFDIAVHAGWVVLAAHDSRAPAEEGATCAWVNGWIPVDMTGCSRLPLDQFAIRLEHRLARAHEAYLE